MAIIYCDYLNGNDTTGNGTGGAPYKTLSKVFSVLTTSDSIALANTANHMASNVTWPSLSFSLDAPLIIEAYDAGGSITAENGDGTVSPYAIIENSGTTQPWLTGCSNNLKVIGVEFKNYTTNFWSNLSAISNGNFFNCHFNNIASFQVGTVTKIVNCSFTGTGAQVFTLSANCLILGCFFNRYKLAPSNNPNILFSVFKECTTSAIDLSTQDNVFISHCTFIGNNLNSATADRGIMTTQASCENTSIISCHFQNYTGAGGVAVFNSSTLPTTRGTVAMLGANSFFNVTTKYSAGMTGVAVMDLTNLDVEDGSDPLENVAANNFTKKITADSIAMQAQPYGLLGTPTLLNLTAGGPQNLGGAVGGDTESSYAGV